MEVVDHQESSVMGSKEQQQAALIAKGKRTKRQRLHSPIPFAVPTNSSSGELGGFVVVADHDDHHSDFVPPNNNDHYQIINNNTNFSPSSSSAHDELLQQFNNNTTTTTEEEEDMANCLILLAQGRPPCSPPTKRLDTGPFHHVTNNVRRFSAENVEKGGRVGCYAYECKTCYRTFPSFQALGGHRASHKKPKAMEAEKKHILCSDDEEIQVKNNNITTTHSLSLQLNQRGSLNSSGKAKVHECAICGAEFTSGQALGGHMRRHRAMPVGTNTALSLTPMNMETEDQRQPKRQRSVLSLDLDLNLPAPQEHDQRSESKFLIKSNQQQQQQQPQQQQHNKQQQQQPLVFPARTLVDCHY